MSAPSLPEELEPQATLVCNGLVISVEPTGIEMVSVYPNLNPSSYPEKIMHARIKVLHVFKGTASAEIEMSYRTAQSMFPTVDGPRHIGLKMGERHRFFLRPSKASGSYVGVLDGIVDDDGAVETLWPREANDSPYLSKSEATQMALDYMHKKRPNEKFNPAPDRVNIWPSMFEGTTWSVTVFRETDKDKRQKTYSSVFVKGDRTIDEENTQRNLR